MDRIRPNDRRPRRGRGR